MALIIFTAETTITDSSPTPAPAPVVSTTKGTSLADKLDLKNLPLASTPGGRVFAMKALHPSDHEIKSARVPGGNCLSVSLCSDQVFTLPIEEAQSSVSLTLSPNPLLPASVQLTSPGGIITDMWSFANAAFGGSVIHNPESADIQPTLTNFNNSVERYRITSQSATVELIAPSLSDQGTVTAAQWHCPPRTASYYDLQKPNPSHLLATMYPDLWLYEKPVTTDQMVLGTQAYTSKAREGCYMPLKLTSFKFRDANDPVWYKSTDGSIGASVTRNVPLQGPFNWPFYINAGDDVVDVPRLVLPKNCGSNFGIINFSGMAAKVALRVRVRQVLEVTCQPSSTYAPLVEVSLPPDEMAVRMYLEISSRMADAYPAAYNDLGKLKNIVLSLGRKVAPFVDPILSAASFIPGTIGQVASSAKKVLSPASDSAPTPKKKAAAQNATQVLARLRASRKSRRT